MEKLNKNNVLVLGIVFALLFCVSLVSATISLDLPSASSTISGIVVLNVTNSTGFDEMVNCTIYAGSSLTSNTTWTEIGFFVNDTLDNVNGTFDSSILEDATDYVLNASCTNSSASIQEDTNTLINIDNTVPIAPSSLSPADGTSDDDGDLTLSATVVGENTTSCTVFFTSRIPGSGGSSQTMTHTGDTCSLTLTSVPEETYEWYVRASDGTNTTDSASQRFLVDIDTPSNYLFQGKETDFIEDVKTFSVTSDEGGLTKFGIVFIFVVVSIVGIIIYKRR